MKVSYRDQVKLTDYLISKVEEALAGRNEDECLNVFPHDKYHLGILAPRSNRIGTAGQPDFDLEDDVPTLEEDVPVKQIDKELLDQNNDQDDEVLDTLSSLESEDGERFSRESILNSRGAPSALGFEFSLKPPHNSPINLAFEIAFALYTRRFPTWKQQTERLVQENPQDTHLRQTSVRLVDRHKRHDIHIPNLEVSIKSDDANPLEIEEVFDKAIHGIFESERHELDVWRMISRMSIPRSALTNEEIYLAYLNKLDAPVDLPPIKVKLILKKLKMADGRIRIGVYLLNDTMTDSDSSLSSAHNTQRHLYDVQVVCKVLSGTLQPIELISSPMHYQYDPNVWVVGQNCSAGVDLEIPEIWTQNLAKSNQLRLQSKEAETIPEPRFDVLSETPQALLSRILDAMISYANIWEAKLNSGGIELRNTDEERACQQDLNNFRDEIERFRDGVNALANDKNLLDAFKAMHRVFLRVGSTRGIEKWRLFQIGFIVTQLPALALREGTVTSDTMEYADVLWFPTGGGKTEAYLGLIACTLLFDRLRGKSAGVSAWLRFPLRMLSVQQLQRAVKVLYETEQERLNLQGNLAQNSDPISLGYFVGKSSTPNQLNDQDWSGKWKISELHKNLELRNQLRLIRDCPRCNTQAVEIKVDKVQFRISHVCSNCGLDLKIYVSDDEIYRYLPSVLIGTVDKLPSVSWRKHFSHIWGGIDAKCPEHGYRSGQYCMVYGCNQIPLPIQLYDPIPALLVQDELHLLREELGTFAGHYETLAEACETRNDLLPSKIIAATATVEGLDRQARHLYSKQARRFPGKGYSLGESFYSEFSLDENGDTKIARRYLAFKPPYLRPPEASARVLEINHETIRYLYSLVNTNQIQEIISEVGLVDATTKGQILALLDKYDATLTYVGSKAHGSRIERILSDEISGSIPYAGKRALEVAYLNGESSLDEIADTIDNLETETAWDDDNRLDSVIGTSLISHGVDVNRFNFMVMSGMPGRTAEYIQASSRSGRSFVGIVIVVLSPWLLREQSFYHRFDPYHHHMEHLIEPVPINRFSRFAVNKTMPGIIAGVLNAFFAPLHGLTLDRVQNVERALSHDFSEDELFQIILRSYDLDADIHSASLQMALQERVMARFRNEIRRIRAPGSADRVTDALSRKPMTSLRDIDEPVPFEPKEYAFSSLRWTQK